MMTEIISVMRRKKNQRRLRKFSLCQHTKKNIRIISHIKRKACDESFFSREKNENFVKKIIYVDDDDGNDEFNVAKMIRFIS
jgi:hypothetical protein